MGHLSAPEHDGELDLVAFGEEPLDVAHLGRVVVHVDLRSELHLLDDDLGGLAAGLFAPLLLLVLVALVVHEPADRRVRVRSNFHEVELCGPGDGDRFGERLDAELFAFAADEQHFAGSDAVVDPGVVCAYVTPQ